MNDLNITGLYHYNKEPKRGLYHYDSSIFPYICTAVVRGRWNTLEYKYELSKIAEKYKVDFSKRGHLTHAFLGL